MSLEALEDRCVPATFTFVVDRTTDNGAAGVGQGVGNTGDLRYCVAQVNAAHGAAGDTDVITFSPSVFAVPRTIAFNPALGGLTITDLHALAIQGPTSLLSISGLNTYRIFQINAGANVTISQIDFTAGRSPAGSAILDAGGRLAVVNCTFDHNTAVGGNGGGAVEIANNGVGTVIGCTFTQNAAPAQGGGGLLNFSGTATVINSTFDHNTAANGGGVGNNGAGDFLSLINCTVVNNRATVEGGGLTNGSGGVLRLTNVLIAQNSAPLEPDLFLFTAPQFTSHNLIGVEDGTSLAPLTNGVNGNQVGTRNNPIDPKIGPLQNNGGPTQTVALLAGSPAIDAGDDSVLSIISTDQRGLPRESGAHVDIGAFEVQQAGPPQGRRYGPILAPPPPVPAPKPGRRAGA